MFNEEIWEIFTMQSIHARCHLGATLRTAATMLSSQNGLGLRMKYCASRGFLAKYAPAPCMLFFSHAWELRRKRIQVFPLGKHIFPYEKAYLRLDRKCHVFFSPWGKRGKIHLFSNYPFYHI